ncbi:lipopolysaccharide heptosyltransferase 1, partial [Escherichia coli]
TVYGPTDPGLIGGYGKNQVECRSTSMSLADLPAQTVFQNLNFEIITNKLTSEIR